jgi:hypothetical protein
MLARSQIIADWNYEFFRLDYRQGTRVKIVGKIGGGFKYFWFEVDFGFLSFLRQCIGLSRCLEYFLWIKIGS